MPLIAMHASSSQIDPKRDGFVNCSLKEGRQTEYYILVKDIQEPVIWAG